MRVRAGIVRLPSSFQLLRSSIQHKPRGRDSRETSWDVSVRSEVEAWSARCSNEGGRAREGRVRWHDELRIHRFASFFLTAPSSSKAPTSSGDPALASYGLPLPEHPSRGRNEPKTSLGGGLMLVPWTLRDLVRFPPFPPLLLPLEPRIHPSARRKHSPCSCSKSKTFFR